MKRRIAVIGAGISGLGAAWALQRAHDVTLFEANERLGGHSNTVDVTVGGDTFPVDTGFIVYNEVTYPHLTRLFASLGVATDDSDMSFSFTIPGELEYGASLRGMLAHPSNLLRRRYRRMIADIARFRTVGPELAVVADDQDLSGFLLSHGFSEGFVEDYILPMTGAIWSARHGEIRRHPAGSMLQFLMNHGLIEIVGRPQWRTVRGGSREYVRRLIADFSGEVRTGAAVRTVVRDDRGASVTTDRGVEAFDELVIATHSDQALEILGSDATADERSALGAIRYEPNRAVLHTDRRLMPRRRAVWSSWNSFADPTDREGRNASVTYWMNRLQNLDTSIGVFVTLNPIVEPDPAQVIAEYQYAHPQFDAAAVAAQRTIAGLQGRNRTWFAGAYLGYGFHEDGLQSGLNVAAALDAPTTWFSEVTPMSSAPAVGELTS